MAAKLIVVPRNFHYEATLGTEFDAAIGCSIVNTQNRKRSRVWRTADTSFSDAGDAQYVTGTFDDGLTRTADFFAMFLHRCHGRTVRLQLYSDANWTTLAYDSGFETVPNIGSTTEGLDWGIEALPGYGPYDPFFVRGPHWHHFSPTDFLSYKISFDDGETNIFDFYEVCQFTLGLKFEPEYLPAYGAELGFIDLTELDRSRGGSLYSNVGGLARTMKMNLDRVTESDGLAWMEIMRHCGLGRDVVVSLFAEENTRRERDHTMLGVFSSLDAIGRHVSRLTKVIQFQEH